MKPYNCKALIKLSLPLFQISIACMLHPGFSRVVSFDRLRVTNDARHNTPASATVTTTTRFAVVVSSIDLSTENATEYYKMAAVSEDSSTMPVPVISRLSFGLATKRPRTDEEPDMHASSWQRGTAVHVAFVIVGSASGGALLVAVVAAILCVIRRRCASAAEDEQRLLPGETEKSSPISNKTFLAATDSIPAACKVESCRPCHGVGFVPTESDHDVRTRTCQGSCVVATIPWRPAMWRRNNPGATPGADLNSEVGLPAAHSIVCNQFASNLTATNGADEIPPTNRGVCVIVPRGALGDNTATKVTLRTLDIPTNKLVPSAGQMQLSPVFQCSAPGIVELHRPLVMKIPCRTFAPRGWRLGVLYRDLHCSARTRWKYADQLDRGSRTNKVGVRNSEQSDARQCQQTEPHRYDQMRRQQSPPHEQLHERCTLNDNQQQHLQQQQQQQQHNPDVLFTYDDEYVYVQTRHLTAVVCVAWPLSPGVKSASPASCED